MNELALFAGAGGGILGGKLLGWRTVCAVELNAFCARRLMQRQNEGHLPSFPIWDDVRTFDGYLWRGIIDVVSGGFPCKGISSIGYRSGLAHAESGLWRDMARIVGEVQPRFVIVENAPGLLYNGGVSVLGSLAKMGFGCRWGIMGAIDAGARHERERIWIIADTQMQPGVHQPDAWKVPKRLPDYGSPWKAGPWDEATPRVCRVDDGVAHRLDRGDAIGNGQVPAVVRLAWSTLAPSLQTSD